MSTSLIVLRSQHLAISIGLLLMVAGCTTDQEVESRDFYYPNNLLDYTGTPDSTRQRNSLVFSDQGAWFGYGFPAESKTYGGFSGPFLMTQENGVWCSQSLSRLDLVNPETGETIDWDGFEVEQKSYNSHLHQLFTNERFRISQELFFFSAHTAFIVTHVENVSSESSTLEASWSGSLMLDGMYAHQDARGIKLISEKSNATGLIELHGDSIEQLDVSDNTYVMEVPSFTLAPGESKRWIVTHSFIFSEYDAKAELDRLASMVSDPKRVTDDRIKEKEGQLESLYDQLDSMWAEPAYKDLLAKAVLTLQNNWRISAGELKHGGVFPSYHYLWFHGFWAWDSWKHAAGIAHYDPSLAMEQVRAMYDFQMHDGFIPDCVYRDTTIERHNYRNTKPPLSAWAVWKIYEQTQDVAFLEEMYPKILNQHEWWYNSRDHDQDGLCEYGSTDGTLIAAKWESGMDNAVRFDSSAMLQNNEEAYSLDQESVDLNAFLYAEKRLLAKMAQAMGKTEEIATLERQADELKKLIQAQFFDPTTGWFYDTSIDGSTFIPAMGSEGWIPLWAEVATHEQAEAVMQNMMKPEQFFTRVPFQTLSANHPDFKPDGGYWRGPAWIDQSYFGIQGLRNYGYHQEANEATYKLMHGAVGVMTKGESIRENYQPMTGEGLEAQNFSWSAAHYLLLLLNQ